MTKTSEASTFKSHEATESVSFQDEYTQHT